MQSDAAFTLEPVASAEQIALLHDWAAKVHVKEWWPDFTERLASLEAGTVDGESDAMIASLNGKRLAFVQTWRPTRGPDYPWQHEVEEKARGIDLFIGEEANLSKGHGANLVRFVAEKLMRQGASRVLIDPAVNNARAIRCYEKAGFKALARVKDCDGESLLMEFKNR